MIFSAIVLVIIHAVCSMAIFSPSVRAVLILGADAFFLVALVLWIKHQTFSAIPDEKAGIAVSVFPDSGADVSAVPEDKTSQGEIEALTGRLDRIYSFFRSCPDLFDEVLAENARLEKAKKTLESLRFSVQSLDHLIENIKQNADQVTGVANVLSGSAEKGFSLSQNVQSNVVALAENISTSLRETTDLLGESEKITGILTIMSNIAATTNVLSINASIVAARAGIKGKEFEVVAREIRKLSVSTEESLNSIALLIKNIQGKIVSVSGKLTTVNNGMLREKDSMLSVAGALQGITLSIEIIQSVTGTSGAKAQDTQRGLSDTLKLLDTAVQAITVNDTGDKIRFIKGTIAGILEKEKTDRGIV
jgi:methyl-accepting chemotaxis protein